MSKDQHSVSLAKLQFCDYTEHLALAQPAVDLVQTYYWGRINAVSNPSPFAQHLHKYELGVALYDSSLYKSTCDSFALIFQTPAVHLFLSLSFLLNRKTVF